MRLRNDWTLILHVRGEHAGVGNEESWDFELLEHNFSHSFTIRWAVPRSLCD